MLTDKKKSKKKKNLFPTDRPKISIFPLEGKQTIYFFRPNHVPSFSPCSDMILSPRAAHGWLRFSVGCFFTILNYRLAMVQNRGEPLH